MLNKTKTNESLDSIPMLNHADEYWESLIDPLDESLPESLSTIKEINKYLAF